MPPYENADFDPLAPVARVEVIGPTGTRAGVPMLLDTGSDTSIIPRHIADAVGASVRPSAYSLEFLDGGRVAAEETRVAVRLSPFRFDGAYLVEDHKYGILGRNVLRHVVLRLDGPRQAWDLVSGVS